MLEALSLIVGLAVGLFGGIGLERYRNARKDHEHRQSNYHQLLGAADDFRNAHEEPAPPRKLAAAAIHFAHFRQGIEVFGARDVMDATHAFELAVQERRWEEATAARERMAEAAHRDVGPRSLRFGSRS